MKRFSVGIILAAIFIVCQTAENEFIYFKFHKKVISQNVLNKSVNEITDEVTKIPELNQLMHTWYKIFVRKDKVELMINQSKNIFKKFLFEIFKSYAEETLEDENNALAKKNRSFIIDLSLSLNKTHVARSIELLNLFNHQNQTKIFKANCNSGKSLQQVFIDFYKLHVLERSKNFFIMTLSQESFNGNDSQPAEIEPFELKNESAMTIIISELLNHVSRDVWRCDPKLHQKGKTYEDIDSLRSIAIMNSQFMVPKYSTDCKEYENFDINTSNRVTKLSRRYGYNYTLDDQNIQLFDCQNIDSSVSICLTTPDDSTDDHKIIKRPEDCKNNLKLLNKIKNCICTYTDFSQPQVFVNIAQIMADTDRNFVITGVRLKKDIDHINMMIVITIEIQQGVLEENGKVNQSTVEWKASEPEKQVLFTLWGHSYTFSTFDLEGKKDEVVVGVQFSEMQDKSIILQPLVKNFNFSSGVLYNDSHFSPKPNDTDDRCKKTVDLSNADIPTLEKSQSLPEPGCNKVTFGPSSFLKDRGQTTVPYLDIQDVVTTPPSALSGVSLYYKGSKGFGGFLAPKLITYNTAEYLTI